MAIAVVLAFARAAVGGARVIAAVFPRIFQFIDEVACLPDPQLIGSLNPVPFPQQIQEVNLSPPTDSPNGPDLRSGGGARVWPVRDAGGRAGC